MEECIDQQFKKKTMQGSIRINVYFDKCHGKFGHFMFISVFVSIGSNEHNLFIPNNALLFRFHP